jgi:hypothetical protein
VAKKTMDADRKARVEEMRRAQQAAERRRTLLIGGVVAVVVIALIVTVTVVVRNFQKGQDPASIGVAASAAACDPVITDKTSGSSVHVGPGTDKATVTKVNYTMVPPTSGEHFVVPDSSGRKFFTAADRPKTETLVHNLEHGYTVVWYTSATPQAQVDQLKKLSELAPKDSATATKFIVSSWDDSYGAFPTGKTIGISHWGAKQGFRQLCGQVSGAVVKSFIEKHPYSDAPEPNAA